MKVYDIAAIAVSLSVFFFYQLYAITMVLFVGNSVAQVQLSKNIKNAFQWVKKHRKLADAPSVTLAIQTLRNTILVAIFLGGGAFTSAFTLLNSVEAMRVELYVRNVIVSILLFLSFLGFASGNIATYVRCGILSKLCSYIGISINLPYICIQHTHIFNCFCMKLLEVLLI